MKAVHRYVFAAGIAVVYLYSFPYFPKVRNANELPRIYLTQAMVDEGTFAIDTGARRWGETADMSPSGGHVYSNKAPGSSVLAIPAYVALKAWYGEPPSMRAMTWAFRLFTGVLPTLLFLVLLSRWLARFVPEEGPRRMAVLAYSLGTMAMTYSVLFISHQLSAICIATAYFLSVSLLEGRRPRFAWILAGFLAGCAPLVDYQAAFAGVPVVVYVAWHLIKHRRGAAGIDIALACLGAAVPIGFLFYYHNAAFGDWLTTGYAASETFAHHHQKGFLGMDRLRWEAFFGSVLAPDNGLIVFSPVMLLCIPGIARMLKRPAWRWHGGVAAAIILIFIAFISSINFWRGGWQVGPRYITAMMPFAMAPIAVAMAQMEATWWTRGLALGLVTVGVVVYTTSSAVYPHFPDRFDNPIYEVVFRLLREDHAPYNAGWLIGLRGVVSLIPVAVVVAGLWLAVALPTRKQWKSAVLGAVLAITVVASYSAFPRGGKADEQAYKQWVAGAMPKR